MSIYKQTFTKPNHITKRNSLQNEQSSRILLDVQPPVQSNIQSLSFTRSDSANNNYNFRQSYNVGLQLDETERYHLTSRPIVSDFGPQYKGDPPQCLQQYLDESGIVLDSNEDGKGFINQIWKKKGLKILIIILKLIGLITKMNFQTNFRLINRRVFDIIGDKSSNFNFYLYKNYFKFEQPTNYQKLKYKIRQLILVPLRKLSFYNIIFNSKFILRPESITSIGWNIYILIILNMNVLYVSARVAFKFDDESENDSLQSRQIFFDYLPTYSFLLEIILKFNTCYYYKGAVISNRFLIAKNYLKTSFLFDIFVIIPFFISLRFQVDYLDLVLILKVFQIKKFSQSLFDRLELSANEIAIFDLFKLGYTIIAAAHFCACIWFEVGSTGDPNQKSWIKVSGIEDDDWVDQYLTSFYFSIVTMTTIGYGDIVPQNLRERIFTIGLTIAAVGVFGYSIGNINSIYSEWSKKQVQYRKDMNDLKKFLRLKGLDKQLAERIRKYFEYIWNDKETDNEVESFKFNHQIPPQLLDEMKIDVNMKILKKISFLSSNFSDQFLLQLSKHLIEERFAPEQVIFNVGEQSDYLYILQEGNLDFYIQLQNRNNQQIIILETLYGKGKEFGHLEFFKKQHHQLSCKSNQFSYILKISRQDFVDLLKQNYKDYQVFCSLQDEVTYINKQDTLNSSCSGCYKYTHTIQQCPMITGYPNRSKVLLNYRRNIPEDRKHYIREPKKINARIENQSIQNSVILFICKNSLIKQYQLDKIILPSEELLPINNKQQNNNNNKRKLSFKACNDAFYDMDSNLHEKLKRIVQYIKIETEKLEDQIICKTSIHSKMQQDIKTTTETEKTIPQFQQNNFGYSLYYNMQEQFDKIRVFQNYLIRNNFGFNLMQLNK